MPMDEDPQDVEVSEKELVKLSKIEHGLDRGREGLLHGLDRSRVVDSSLSQCCCESDVKDVKEEKKIQVHVHVEG